MRAWQGTFENAKRDKMADNSNSLRRAIAGMCADYNLEMYNLEIIFNIQIFTNVFFANFLS